MKKAIYYIIFAAALILAGCTQEAREDNSPRAVDAETVSVTFRAVLPEIGSKTILGESEEGHRKVSWAEGDKIRIVYGNESGDYVDADVSTDGYVNVEIPASEAYYAVYPPVEATINTDKLLVSIPSVQGGKFADAGFMAAKATDADRSFNFGNISGLVCFEVKRSGVTKALLRACDGAYLCGEESLGFDSALSAEPGDCGSEIAVTLDGPGTYYVAVLKDAELSAGIALRFFEGETALPGVLSLAALKASSGEIWNLGAPDEKIYSGDYYISPDGTGDGTSAGSPAGVALLAKLLNTNLGETLEADGVAHAWRVGGKTIHFAAGIYAFNAEHIVSNLAACEPVVLSGESGTVFSSEGASCLKFGGEASFVIEGITFNGCTTEEDGAAINWESTGNLSVRNCVFSANVAAKAGGAVYVSAGTVDIENCDFTGNKAAAGIAYDKEGGLPSGGAVYAICSEEATGNTLVRLNRCRFSENESGSYAANLSIYTSSEFCRCKAWLNACSFKEGYSDNGGKTASQSGERYYGKSIHSDGLSGVGASELAFNNCTVAGRAVTPATDGKWNGMSLVSGERTRMVAVSSTFFGASNGTIFKNYNRGTADVDEVYMVNCLLTNMTNTPSNGKSSINLFNTTAVCKGAYNVLDAVKNNGYKSEHDTKGIFFTDFAWNWNATEWLYEWSTSKTVSEYATQAFVAAFVAENVPDFDAWLKTVDANPYGTDQTGRSRNAEKLNPGAWDTGL